MEIIFCFGVGLFLCFSVMSVCIVWYMHLLSDIFSNLYAGCYCMYTCIMYARCIAERVKVAI